MDEPQPPQHSSIPQFLLETEHPWIIKHRLVLERLPDVESFLCSPPGTKNKTPTSQLQHYDASAGPATTNEDDDDDLDLPLDLQLEVPADLFSTLMINNNHAHTNRAGWPNAYSRLQELQRCPAAALARVRSLDVEVWAHQGKLAASEDLQAEEWQDLEGPAGDKLLDLFASVLTAMTRLERLRWAMLPEFARRIQEGLVSARGLRLPSVRRLEVLAFCEYMIDACPNVEVLEGEGLTRIVARQEEGEKDRRYAEMLAEAAARLPKVKEFSIKNYAELTPSLISAMVKAMPRLVRIRLRGRMPRPPRVRDDSGQWHRLPGGVRFEEVVAVLAEFSDLEELDLPHPAHLFRSIYEGSSWCGTNSLLLPLAERAMETYRWHKDECRQYEVTASTILKMLPQLRRLVIHGKEPTLTPSGDGQVIALWPWSGRFDEYHNKLYRIE